MTQFAEAAIAVLVVLGALFVLVVAIAYFRQRDAIQRINSLGPATALGLPLIVAGSFIAWTFLEGFSWTLLLKTILTIGCLVIVSSIASNVLGRAAYQSGAPLDPATNPNDLAEARADSADDE